MVFDEQESKFFVQNGCVGVFLRGELVEEVKHYFEEREAHDLGGFEDSFFDVDHNLVDLVQSLLNMERVGAPNFDKELDGVESEFFGVLGV